MDDPLARIEDFRDEIAKAWLLRAVEGASLEEIETMPVARIARELPELVADVLRDARVEDSPPSLDPDGREYRRARQIAELGGREEPRPGSVATDIAALQTAILEVLGRRLGDVEASTLLASAARVATVFGTIHAAAAEDLVASRARELEALANTDPLTGLFNLRYMHHHFEHLLGLYRRYGHPFALLVFDVDGLKRINDAGGHRAGDEALTTVAQAVRDTIREIDTPVRMGGDEFCLLAPNQDAAGGRVLADRIAAAVERRARETRSAITISIGTVACPEHALEPERLIELADAAMYRAKAAGARVAIGVPDDADGSPPRAPGGGRERSPRARG